jgi:hypothetical protein
MRASYSHHYRRAVPALLRVLEFRSTNQMHQPVIRALDVIKQTAGRAPRFYDPEEVPLEGIVSSGWRELILMPDKQGHLRVDRLKYELCVLQVLCERLRCKEIWVVGANRYRNPDEDLPTDSEVQRDQYYAVLKLPQEVETFLGGVQREMSEALTLLDRSLPKNPHVRILQNRHGWIALSPLSAQPEPVHLLELKSEILKRWPMTSLLDMLKETDLRTDFSNSFKSATGRVFGSYDVAEAPLTVLVWAGHEHRTEARKQRRRGRKLHRSGLCAPTLHPQRAVPRSHCQGCQWGISGPPASYLGRGDGLRSAAARNPGRSQRHRELERGQQLHPLRQRR